MDEPKRASDTPFVVYVETGKSYYWCSCGLSKNQPFCDKSHKGTDFVPVKYVADKNQNVYFCGCKQTQKPPLCDGSHSKS